VRYERALLLTGLGSDPAPALAALRGLAPEAVHLVVAACPPPRRFAAPPEPGGTAPGGWLEALRGAALRAAPEVEVGLVTDLDTDALEQIVVASGVELVVAGPLLPDPLPLLAELRKRRPVAVLWVGAAARPRADRPFTELFCVALGASAEASVADFLRDRGDRPLRVTAFSLARSPGELRAALDVAGVRVPVELAGPIVSAPWRAMNDLARAPVDLVVLARLPRFLLGNAAWPAPVLVLPPRAPGGPAVQRPLDVSDAVALGDVTRLRLGLAYGVGRNPPLPDQEVGFLSGGRVVAIATSRGGEVELPPGVDADVLGVFRASARATLDPLAAVERQIAVVRPGPAPLVLFDAELPDEELPALALARGAELLAVRLRPARSCHLLRDRLRAAGLPPRVVDASAVLDEGDADDVGDLQDAVRLARTATRLREAGFPVAAIVHRGPHAPDARGFAALRAGELAHHRLEPGADPGPRPVSLSARLEARVAAATIGGNRVELELDNGTARRWLLDAIATARERLHLQVYMAADDDVGRAVAAALAAAGRRGVAVRVLVDSLRGLHGSFGMVNQLLDRLSACPGVELRVCRPVAGLPSLEDLKQRDHRKLVVADGALALLGGRNLGHEYYTAFEETKLTRATPWPEVPWLDAGARVEGPAVAALERSFAEAWTGAGGAPFDLPAPRAAGATAVRVVVHRGLRDANTLETYLALVESARSHVFAVNGFPLVLELQHALVRALRRGVRVRALFGPVTPTRGGEPFEGAWGTARTAAMWLVASRIDALLAAGGEAHQLALRDVPGWAPDLGLVQPHVHAKVLSADGRACAVGSANLDVTASYWESELLLLVEDEPLVRAFEARLDGLVAGSVRVDREDPAWQRLVRGRDWLRHWPGVLSL
jgi:phosphatidylserine/phosphatidylglycerophosphate/cardiolipin synthase-like enzyme